MASLRTSGPRFEARRSKELHLHLRLLAINSIAYLLRSSCISLATWQPHIQHSPVFLTHPLHCVNTPHPSDSCSGVRARVHNHTELLCNIFSGIVLCTCRVMSCHVMSTPTIFIELASVTNKDTIWLVLRDDSLLHDMTRHVMVFGLWY